jgi:protein phosphatase
LLLCTDGLYERIEDRELAAIASGREPDTACRELIWIAIERVCSDNVSAVVLQLRGPEVRA